METVSNVTSSPSEGLIHWWGKMETISNVTPSPSEGSHSLVGEDGDYI